MADKTIEGETSSPSKIEEIKLSLENTKSQVKDTIDSVLEREAKLSELEMTSNDLQQQGALFQNKARAVRRRMCCQNTKQCFMIGFIVFIVLVIVYFALIHEHVMDAINKSKSE